MTFSIDPAQGITDEFRRVTGEQLTAAISALEAAPDQSMDAAVHDARKRCKRMRAVFRLVGPALGARRYRRLDVLVRDAARELSGARDAAALVKMFDDLMAAHPAALDEIAVAAVRAGFEARSSAGSEASPEDHSELRRARERLEAAREAALASKLHADGFDAVGGGLTDTYARARSDLAAFRKKASIELSHDWRKAVKYGWHHIELMEHLAPTVLTPAADAFHHLADALGDSHNLAVMMDALEAEPARFGGFDTAAAASALADASRKDLEERAVSVGLRLYAETPNAYGRRFERYWQAALAVGGELPTGELAAIAGARR